MTGARGADFQGPVVTSGPCPAENRPVLVSIVLPCFDNVDDTRACLATLRRQVGGVPLQTIVVDNGSRDATSSLDRECPGVEVVRLPQNLGFAGGVNRGLAAARGEFVLVLNNDTLAGEHLVERLLRPLIDDPRIAMSAPVSNHVKGEARIEVGAAGVTDEGRATLERLLTQHAGGRVQDVASLAGLCLMIRRPLLERIGTFDERFGIGNFEDDDLCLRARFAGARLVVVRDAFLHHHGHRTFQAMAVDYRQVLADREALYRRKWRDDPAAQAWFVAADGGDPTSAAVAGLERHPHWPDGHWLIARAAAARGRTLDERARASLDAFLTLCPLHGQGWLLRLGDALARGDDATFERGLAWALSELTCTPDELARLLLARARRLLQTGATDAALADVAAATDPGVTDAGLWNEAGALLLDAGRHAEAAERFVEADRLGSEHALGNLAICRFRLGDVAGALRLWRDALVRRPDDVTLRNNLAAALAAAGR